MNAKTIVSAFALATVFIAGAAQARISNRDGYTEDGKNARAAAPYQDGARFDANCPRSPFLDGARAVESYEGGSRLGDRWAYREIERT